MLEGGLTSSGKQSIEVTKVWNLVKNSQNVYEYQEAQTLDVNPSVASVDPIPNFGDRVTCSNILKEIVYTVSVKAMEPDGIISRSAYLKVDKITAEIVT